MTRENGTHNVADKKFYKLSKNGSVQRKYLRLPENEFSPSIVMLVRNSKTDEYFEFNFRYVRTKFFIRN